MVLTLRPTEEQQRLLEKVQMLFNEPALTKSIFACCVDYLKLRTANAKLEQDHKALQRRYEELLNTTSQYVSAQDQLRATVLQHQQK